MSLQRPDLLLVWWSNSGCLCPANLGLSHWSQFLATENWVGYKLSLLFPLSVTNYMTLSWSLASSGPPVPYLRNGNHNSVYLPGLLLRGSSSLLFEFRALKTRYGVEVLRTLKKDNPKQPNSQDCVSVTRVLIYLCTNGCVSKYWAPFSSKSA